MKPVKYLVVHHSASSLDTTLADIDSWHRQRGWTGVGYSHVIDGEGRVHEGRGVRAHLAANPPYNGESIAVCVVGDNTRVDRSWTKAQWTALARYVEAVQLLFPGVEVVGHRDVGWTKTACPGVDIRGEFPPPVVKSGKE